MPTTRRTELPTRRTVSLRSTGPNSGVRYIFQLIYIIIAGVGCNGEHEYLTGGEGEGEDAATATWSRQLNPRPRLIAFRIRTRTYKPPLFHVRDNAGVVIAIEVDGEPPTNHVQPRRFPRGRATSVTR